MPSDTRPGLDPRRLVRLMREAVDRCGLDLHGAHGSDRGGERRLRRDPRPRSDGRCGRRGGRGRKRLLLRRGDPGADASVARAGGRHRPDRARRPQGRRARGGSDIVTNSGQVRPIDAETVSCMKPSAVVPLMYEGWEYRPADLDLEACRSRGILVAGTNERHPAVDVFAFLGQMAVMQLHDAGYRCEGARCSCSATTTSRPFIVGDLVRAGARRRARNVRSRPTRSLPAATRSCWPCSRGTRPVLDADAARLLSERAPGAVLVQYWGDADRDALAAAAVPVWPPQAPAAGHMGILPSAVGPEPIVRLQSGGLKVGQVLARGRTGRRRTTSPSSRCYESVHAGRRAGATCAAARDGPDRADRARVAGGEVPGRRPGPRVPTGRAGRCLDRAGALGVRCSRRGARRRGARVLDSAPDCVVVSSYDRVLPGRVLARSPFMDVHYAPLPQYRGRANVNWAIINGERETAITVHVLAEGLDAGNILYQQRVPIGPDDTVGELYAKLNEVQRQVLAETVAAHLAGYQGEPQDEEAATYGCTRVPDDGEIDWAAPTELSTR